MHLSSSQKCDLSFNAMIIECLETLFGLRLICHKFTGLENKKFRSCNFSSSLVVVGIGEVLSKAFARGRPARLNGYGVGRYLSTFLLLESVLSIKFLFACASSARHGYPINSSKLVW